MAAVEYLFDNSFISLLWEHKIIISGGILAGISIFEYYHESHVEKKKIKKIEEKLQKIRKKILVMSEKEKYEIKEVVNELRSDFKTFKTEVRNEFKEIYVLIANLKTDTSLNSLKITMYVSIAVFIIGSVLSITLK